MSLFRCIPATLVLCLLTVGSVSSPVFPAQPLPAVGLEDERAVSNLGTLVNEVGGIRVWLPARETLRWVEGLLAARTPSIRAKAGDGGGANVVAPLSVIQTDYSDPVNGNVVLLIWEETSPNPAGVDILVNGEVIGTVLNPGDPVPVPIEFAFVTNLEPGEWTFGVREAEVADAPLIEESLPVLADQPFSNPENLQCRQGEPGVGSCELIVSWLNPGPLPSTCLVLLDEEGVAEVLTDSIATEVSVPGVPPGGHTTGVFGFLQETPGVLTRLYRGSRVNTSCDITCVALPCDPPSELRICQVAHGTEGNAVRIDWVVPGAAYSQGVRGFVDGELVGSVLTPPGTPWVVLRGLESGEHIIGVQGDCGPEGGTSDTAEQTITLLTETPHGNPLVGDPVSTFNEAEGTTDVSWEIADPSEFIDVFRLSPGSGLSFLKTIPGSSTGVIAEADASAGEVVVLQFFATIQSQCHGSELVFCGNRFIRGACLGEGLAPRISDAIFHLQYLFAGGELPACLAACDLDANGNGDLSDPVYLLNYLFLGGPAPVGWPDSDGNGRPEPACDAAPVSQCLESQAICR